MKDFTAQQSSFSNRKFQAVTFNSIVLILLLSEEVLFLRYWSNYLANLDYLKYVTE